MKKVTIVGFGYVGKSVVNFFADHYEVRIYDPFVEWTADDVKRYEGKNVMKVDKTLANESDLAIICVPTPMAEDGSVDLSIIEDAFSWLTIKNVLIKSTVPPGTTKLLSRKYNREIVFSPEYIGEGKYVVQWWKDKGYPHPTDMKYHDFQIFGGAPEARSAVLQFFKKILGPDVKYMQTDSTTAELVKYMENSWGAMKVTFCNEFFDIANTFGVDYDELRELWLLDGRVERMHTAVFKDKRGFGGKCFPKDVHGIVKAAIAAGYTPELLQEVLSVNDKFSSLNE